MSDNLFPCDQKPTTNAFRDNYDKMRWDDKEKIRKDTPRKSIKRKDK